MKGNIKKKHNGAIFIKYLAGSSRSHIVNTFYNHTVILNNMGIHVILTFTLLCALFQHLFLLMVTQIVWECVSGLHC